jgi:isoquinoline 1-oxidoreductase beta subunit
VVVARSPKFGGKVASFDATAAKAVAGVVDVKQVSNGVAVYAKGFWPAKMGRDALKITWDDSKAEKRGSAELLQQFRGLSKTAGKLVKAEGKFEESMAKGGRVIEVEYVFPYLAHAAMEPLNAYLKWDGDTAYARYGCQFPTPDHMAISKVLGLPIEKVKIDVLLAGGSFGRRAQQSTHQAIELAEVAKAIGPGKPVKLVWTREDDMRGGYYRPYCIHRMRGAVRDGKIEAWSDTIVSQSIMKGSFFESMMFKDGLDPTSYEGSNEIPYDVENFRCDMHQVDVGVPVLWWRSVGHTHTGYVVEAFVDELLEAAGKDPIEGRLEELQGAGRPCARRCGGRKLQYLRRAGRRTVHDRRRSEGAQGVVRGGLRRRREPRHYPRADGGWHRLRPRSHPLCGTDAGCRRAGVRQFRHLSVAAHQ